MVVTMGDERIGKDELLVNEVEVLRRRGDLIPITPSQVRLAGFSSGSDDVPQNEAEPPIYLIGNKRGANPDLCLYT
jgi:hypothetical protein